MRAIAKLRNSRGENEVMLTSGDRSATLTIPSKASGFGSSASGGKRLRLAPPACATRSIHREAGGLGIEGSAVEVEASAKSPAEGLPARAIEYTVGITPRTPEAKSLALAARAHRLAEILGTVRQAIPVTLGRVDALPTA